MSLEYRTALYSGFTTNHLRFSLPRRWRLPATDLCPSFGSSGEEVSTGAISIRHSMTDTILHFPSIFEVLVAIHAARQNGISSTAHVTRKGYEVVFHATPIDFERVLFVSQIA